MKSHIDKARSNLGELGALAQRTEEAEREILKRAEDRLATLQRQIDRARPGVESAPDRAQQRYLDMIEERGRLNIVIAKAKSNLL